MVDQKLCIIAKKVLLKYVLNMISSAAKTKLLVIIHVPQNFYN